MAELGAERITEMARLRGLSIDAARAEGLRAQLNSLRARIAALGDLIPREVAPPPNLAPR